MNGIPDRRRAGAELVSMLLVQDRLEAIHRDAAAERLASLARLAPARPAPVRGGAIRLVARLRSAMTPELSAR
jgi:hypothetical protein